MTKNEVMQMALDALEQLDGWDTATQGDIIFDPSDEIEALRTALAQPQHKPLTDEEIQNMWADHCRNWQRAGKVLISPTVFARTVEAAHGIKN